MKKMFLVLTALVLLIGLIGCDNGTTSNNDDNGNGNGGEETPTFSISSDCIKYSSTSYLCASMISSQTSSLGVTNGALVQKDGADVDALKSMFALTINDTSIDLGKASFVLNDIVVTFYVPSGSIPNFQSLSENDVIKIKYTPSGKETNDLFRLWRYYYPEVGEWVYTKVEAFETTTTVDIPPSY